MTTAVGTLKGPLHGGANEEVMIMLREIGSLDRVEEYIRGRLARKELIMGFGHRVYKTVDPRATYLKTFAKQVATDTGNLPLYEMSQKIEGIMAREVGAKGIWPNVDFYSATTYHSIGLELDLFTPMFAMSRMAGWAGHCIEQLKDNRLIRPMALYVGPHGLAWTAPETR
jgi:citrate synthase